MLLNQWISKLQKGLKSWISDHIVSATMAILLVSCSVVMFTDVIMHFLSVHHHA